jgi:hypothetical protein
MNALAMQLELKRLALKHGATSEPCILPLTEPASPHDLIIEGFAATCDVDRSRMKFRPWAFTVIPWEPLPPLLFRHGRPAGKLLEMRHDDRGRLFVRALVTDPEAKRCGGLSVAATVQTWELRDVDSANFHALITSATVDEISSTDRPCNPEALILHRYRQSPVVEYYDHMKDFVTGLQKLVELLKDDVRRRAVPTDRHTARHVDRRHVRHVMAPATSRPKTEFAKLVQEINRREQHQHQGRA